MKTLRKILILLSHFSVVFGKYVDLSHVYSNTDMSIWPGNTHYNLTLKYAGPLPNSNWSWVAKGDFVTSEHAGTHMDAPYHFYETGDKVADIPLEKLHGPGVVIDIKDKVAQNKDYTITVADLEAWEATNGPIPDNAIVIMYSDLGKHFGNDLEYLGTDNPADATSRHWPGFSIEAVKWLMENRPSFLGFAVDTLTCDAAQTDTVYPVHTTLLPSGRICLENTANVDKLPASGAHVFIMPMKLKDGTGAAARSFAVWDEDWLSASAPPCMPSKLFFGFTPIVLLFTVLF